MHLPEDYTTDIPEFALHGHRVDYPVDGMHAFLDFLEEQDDIIEPGRVISAAQKCLQSDHVASDEGTFRMTGNVMLSVSYRISRKPSEKHLADSFRVLVGTFPVTIGTDHVAVYRHHTRNRGSGDEVGDVTVADKPFRVVRICRKRQKRKKLDASVASPRTDYRLYRISLIGPPDVFQPFL